MRTAQMADSSDTLAVASFTEHIHMSVNNRFNGSGVVRRTFAADDKEAVRIMQYNGIFPSLTREDTDTVLQLVEECLAGGAESGSFEHRRKTVKWHRSMRKNEEQ